MTYTGVLLKMDTAIGDPIQYYLKLNDNIIHMNDLLEQELQIRFEGYQCLSCGASKKIYRQGNCYDCFYSRPEVGDWVIRPELSKAHLGIEDRDLEFEKEAQLKPHIVYLALSSNVKVGVTRKSQVPTRWIDQGASAALAILETPNRYLAGISEVAIKQHISDKTNWRRMLKNEIADIDLPATRAQMAPFVPEAARPFLLTDDHSVTMLHFPVNQYPQKVKSLNLVKTPIYSGRLKGIKGQYLLFEDETVFNIRGNEGTVVTLNLA